MPQDTVTLTLPVQTEYAPTIRMLASGLATLAGMAFDEVDEMRVAAGEAFVYAVETSDDDSEATFRFTVDPGQLEMDVILGAGHESADDPMSEIAVAILGEVVNSCDLTSTPDGARCLHIVKRAGAAHDS